MQRYPLFVPDKLDYVQGRRPQVECILCAIAAKDENVANLSVYRNDIYIISLNLYPYNPGHLLIFPIAHLTDVREISPIEGQELHTLQQVTLTVLDQLYQPKGFNIGYNIGHPAGASIDHLHLHVVPRFSNETGFLDILSGSRIIVEDPLITRERISRAFTKLCHRVGKK